jgi:membrane-associated phospholipid phosphatase
LAHFCVSVITFVHDLSTPSDHTTFSAFFASVAFLAASNLLVCSLCVLIASVAALS